MILMYKPKVDRRISHISKKVVVSMLAVSLLALTLATVPAFAQGNGSPPMNISFQASSGNSAGWVNGPGSSDPVAYLSIGANSAQNGYAAIVLHHFASQLPSGEPSFTATNYAAGTPRLDIFMSTGDYIFIFPSGSGIPDETIIGGVGSYSVGYSGFVTAESDATVTSVFIVADTSQGWSSTTGATPYTSDIKSFYYNGIPLIGPSLDLSFSATSGNSAGWVIGASPPEAELAIGSSSAQYGYAQVTLQHFSHSLPTTEPSFTATSYASGTPRLVIWINFQNYIFIFPTGSDIPDELVINGVATYGNYATFYSDESGATVTSVFIVADTSQGWSSANGATPYTSDITSFNYNGVEYI